MDLELLAKESAKVVNNANANTLLDHTYKIKQQQQQQQNINESQSKLFNTNGANTSTIAARKRTKTNTTADSSSGDEDKNKKRVRKNSTTTLSSSSAAAVKQTSSSLTSDLIDSTTNENILLQNEEVTFTPGEFLIHKSTFNDYDNYDIWCVRDDGYLQKYEPVYLSTGERCHQSADVLAQYTPDKNEFILIKVEEKGKTEQNNIVVCVLAEYEPKNNQNLQLITSTVDTNTLPVVADESAVASSVTPQLDDKVSDKMLVDVEKIDKNTTSSNDITYDELKSTFDIFLQILLSQSLNSEFLFKIKEIQGLN